MAAGLAVNVFQSLALFAMMTVKWAPSFESHWAQGKVDSASQWSSERPERLRKGCVTFVWRRERGRLYTLYALHCAIDWMK